MKHFLYLSLLFALLSNAGCGREERKEMESNVVKDNDSLTENVENESHQQLINDIIVKSKNEQDVINRRYQSWKSRNDTYAIHIATKYYGEAFISENIFHTSPINNSDAILDLREVIWISYAIDKDKKMPLKLFQYDMFDSIHFQIDFTSANPYYQHIGDEYHKSRFTSASGYFNTEVDMDKSPINIKWFLSKQDFSYNTNIDTRIDVQHDNYIKLNYRYGLHPGSEIIEFQPFPGLTTLELLDMNGERIARLEDLPFVVDEWHISTNGKFALLEHQPPINEPFDQSQFEHYVSLYNLHTKKLCFRESSTEFRFSTGAPHPSNFHKLQVGKEDYINRDSTYWTSYSILENGKILKYRYLNTMEVKGFKMTGINENGIIYENNKNGSKLTINNRFEFETLSTTCDE
jgi:hypothetical protein